MGDGTRFASVISGDTLHKYGDDKKYSLFIRYGQWNIKYIKVILKLRDFSWYSKDHRIGIGTEYHHCFECQFLKLVVTQIDYTWYPKIRGLLTLCY